MQFQTHNTDTKKNKTREELLNERVYFSLNPNDVNYVNPEQHALLLDAVSFLTPENVQRYFIDFYEI